MIDLLSFISFAYAGVALLQSAISIASTDLLIYLPELFL